MCFFKHLALNFSKIKLNTMHFYDFASKDSNNTLSPFNQTPNFIFMI